MLDEQKAKTTEVDRKYYSQVPDCKAAVVPARVLISAEATTEGECAVIHTILTEEYGLSSCSIFGENGLLYR